MILVTLPVREQLKRMSPHRRAKEHFRHLRSYYRAGEVMEIQAQGGLDFGMVSGLGDLTDPAGRHHFKQCECLTYLGCRSYPGGIRRFFQHSDLTYVLDEPTGQTAQWAFATPVWVTLEKEEILHNVTIKIR